MLSQELVEKYQVVIGLEVHVQLATRSKLFAPDAISYGKAANTQVSVITLGHPGTLPMVNKKAIEYALHMCLACRCEISRTTHFDRKNYFYPDLPKGYQISQDKAPLGKGGKIVVKLSSGLEKEILLDRIHLEEDAGKSIHLPNVPDTLVDFNRAGTALIELVTEPVISSAEEAVACLTEIRKMAMFLSICDGNMEEGSVRCDANVSVRLRESLKLGNKVEVKNMNSFKNLSRAIEFEFERQVTLLEEGKEVISETRTFDETKGITSAMRTKESMNDYRYFPEPDLSPIEISEEWLTQVKNQLPALPRDYYAKFLHHYKLPEYDAGVLTETKELAYFFEKICELSPHYKAASNWIMGPIKSYLNEYAIEIKDFPISTPILAELIALVEEGMLSFSIASQKIFPELLKSPGSSPLALAQKLNLIQEKDVEVLLPIIQEVLMENKHKVVEYKSGKKGLLGMFMGEVMKKTQGKADPKLTTLKLKELLQN